MQLLFQGWVDPSGQIYFEWGWIRITRYSMHIIALSLLRIVSFIFLTSLFTMTSTTTELTHGVERLLAPFRRFGVPSHELALIVTIALRFVPTLAEELERIIKAQLSRGADIGGTFWRPDKTGAFAGALVCALVLGRISPRRRIGLGDGSARLYQWRWAHQLCGTTCRTGLTTVAVVIALLVAALLIWYPFPDLHVAIGPTRHHRTLVCPASPQNLPRSLCP